MSNNVEYWSEVEAIFAEAIEAGPAGQQAVLDARTAARPAVRAEVESLLAAHSRLSRNAVATPSDPPEGTRSFATVARRVGPFRLMESIGTGGMGTVYRAERADGSFDQQVAVKLISGSAAHPGTIRRFRAERQILASLRHPHIVTLLDGGVTPEGQAFLVMEYVDGVAISTYCRERALSLDARLRLFRQVCSAVHHAHRHFVVHRDLKPANILVTAEGTVKILDFGIAKLLDESGPADSATTAPGAVPLTPNYASPEQLRGMTVTTSSDVYALGVLLYELVTGVRPYETALKPLDDVLRIVADIEAPRPSTRVGSSAGLPYDPARALRGDIDAIVSYAMRKEPERRYGSADELGADVERFLAGKPVLAREPSLGYVVRKLAATHRPVFVSAGVSLVLIVAALVAAVWQGRAAVAERQRAERRFSEVRELANTLIFKIHDEVAPLAGSTPVRRTIVAEALKYLENLAPDAREYPGLQLELSRGFLKVGLVQGMPGTANLGEREHAVVSFEKARGLIHAVATSPDAPPEMAAHYVEATRMLSATLLLMDGRREDSRRTAREAVAVAQDVARRWPSDERGLALLASANFQAALSADRQEAIGYWTSAGAGYEALRARRPGDPARQRNVALVEKYLGSHHMEGGDLAAALEHHRRALALDEQRLAADATNRVTQFDVAVDLANIAQVHYKQNDNAQAAGYYERSLALRQQLAESDPQDALARSKIALAHKNLAYIYRRLGDSARAYRHAQTALAIHDSRHGRADIAARTEHAWTLEALGLIERDRGRFGAACAAFVRAQQILGGVSDDDLRAVHPAGTDARRILASHTASCPAGEK